MIKYVKLAALPADPDLQVRERVNEAALSEYADLYAGGPDAMDPPKGYQEPLQRSDGDEGEPADDLPDTTPRPIYIWDGYTRICAAKLAGLTELPIEVEDGTREDALMRALTEANRKHGMRLEGQDLRRKARLALKVPALRALSNTQIAERIGVNREYVRQERHDLEDSGEIAAVAVTSADGKQIPTRKTRAAKAEPAMPEPSADLVGLLKGLPDDLEIDVDTATELPMEQRCQRVSVWRFTIGYRVMSAASLAQLEQLAQAEDQAMRARAAAPPARSGADFDDAVEEADRLLTEAAAEGDARPLPYMSGRTGGDCIWRRGSVDAALWARGREAFAELREAGVVVAVEVPTEVPADDPAPLPPAAERRAEGRERGARIAWVIARLRLLRDWGCPEVAYASPSDHERAAPRLDDESLARLAEDLNAGRVLVSANEHEGAHKARTWSHLDLATMECVLGVDGAPLIWSNRELAEAALEGGAVEAWTAMDESPAATPVEEMADKGELQATPEVREELRQALNRAIDRGVKEIEGIGGLLLVRAHLIGDEFVLLAGPAARALELLAAHEEADAAGAWWLTTMNVERLRDEVQGYSDQLAAWFTQPHHERSRAEWAAADAAVDTWMGTDCDELPVMEPRTFLAALMHRAVRPDRVVYGIDYGLQRHDPARDAIAHQDVRPTPGRTGEIWLPIDASAEAIAEAIADIQSRCKKHLADPPRLAARVRADLDRVLHTAALWSLPVAALRPTGQWGELPPEGSSGARPDTTVVEVCGQSYLATPPEGVAAPALLIFRGGISSSRLEGVVEFRSPRAADPLPT